MSVPVTPQLIQWARKDINAFTTYVLRNEETGGRITQGRIHEKWHAYADSTRYAILMAHREAGKTQQLSVARTLFALGHNPLLRIVIVSNTSEQAQKIVRSLAKYIESSQELRNVFPHLQPDPNGPWTATKLVIKRSSFAKDPSIQAFGVHGNIQGARVDLMVLDDIIDYENCTTLAQRSDVWQWVQSALLGPLTKNSKVLAVGTPFFRDDVLHRLAGLPGWELRKFPVIDPASGLPNWPEQWPPERIEQKRSIMSSIEWNRQYMCNPRSDKDAVFKQEWIDVALGNGQGKTLARSHLLNLPRGYKVYVGVDLAISRKDSADETVLFTIVEQPDRTYQVINIEAGRWFGAEIERRVVSHGERYQASCIMVENNAAQDYLVQNIRNMAAGKRIEVRGFTTGSNKRHPEYGVAGIASEMEKGRWSIPNDGGKVSSEVARWIGEMLEYDPNSHTGDRLMACWFAREAARQGSRTVQPFNLDLLRR